MINRNFTPFPVLKTERLTLRQLSVDDQQAIFDLRSNEVVNKYLDRAPSKTIQDAINFINKINENIKESNSLYWAISLTSSNTFVGTICLFNFSNETNSCEIGYELMTTFQGKGMMKEAAEKVIAFAFQTLQFQKIAAQTHNANRKSIQLLTGLHFLPSKETNNENPDYTIFTLSSFD